MFARVFNLTKYNPWNLAIWFLMAFQAGTINTGAYIGCHRFASHVTGFATLVGTEFASKNFTAAMSMATVPMFFLLGTMISAYFVDRRVAAHKTPQYTFLMSTITVLMFLAAAGGNFGLFGPFSTPVQDPPNLAILSILCLTCGIQNASITSASGAVVRTTHLTGITTDLGIGLMRILSKGQSSDILKHEKRGTIMRIGIIFAFILGSIISSFVFNSNGFTGYYIPAIISSFLLILDLFERLNKRKLQNIASTNSTHRGQK